MENPSTFKIAEPCHENWNQMTPESQGRFCASCQRCVIDFSNKSTAEMKSIYDREGGDVCGRVNVSQLVKARPAVRTRFNLRGHGLKSLQLFALALMAAFSMLLHTPAKAQKDVVMGKIAYVPPASGRLEGKVTWDSGQPAVGATVRLLRNGVEVATSQTNHHGRYVFAQTRTGAVTVYADAGHGTDAAEIVEIKEHKTSNVNLVLADRMIMGGLRYEESKEMEPVELIQPKELIQPLVFLDSIPTHVIEEITPLHPEAEEKTTESVEPVAVGGFEVRVFPNPTRDHVTLRVTKAGNQDLAATLVDLDGRVLRTLQIKEAVDQAIKIDLSGLPSGIYILQMKAGEEHVTQRILKL